MSYKGLKLHYNKHSVCRMRSSSKIIISLSYCITLYCDLIQSCGHRLTTKKVNELLPILRFEKEVKGIETLPTLCMRFRGFVSKILNTTETSVDGLKVKTEGMKDYKSTELKRWTLDSSKKCWSLHNVSK